MKTLKGRVTARVTRSFLLAVWVVLIAPAGCAVNPATGERQLSFIGEGREIEMGREADGQIVESLGLYPDSALQRYVQGLGERLAAASERPDLPWTFRVVDDPVVNAFALPGGFIYVTRGILAHFTSEAQLVGVLGHEIGHVTARHSVNQMSRQQLAQLGLGVGMILSEDFRSVGQYAMAGLQLLSLRFSRGDESQADELGVRYMTRTGYDPRELAGVMRMLERNGEIQSGGGRIPEWLSTHPDPANRVDHINQLVAASGEDFSGATVERTSFLRRLDGVVFGENPRDGYFEGALFHHPELRIRLGFPAGWTTVNARTAVQGVSGAEDAALILTVAAESPGTALEDFGAQDGVTLGLRDAGTVHGLTAASASFTAETEESRRSSTGAGRLAGTVLFVSHRGATYRVLGVSGEEGWPGYRDVVTASVMSFQAETDPQVLAVQPERLDVVALDGPVPFDTFLERFPSVVRPEVVAVINQVEPGGILAAGTLAKRVVGGR